MDWNHSVLSFVSLFFPLLFLFFVHIWTNWIAHLYYLLLSNSYPFRFDSITANSVQQLQWSIGLFATGLIWRTVVTVSMAWWVRIAYTQTHSHKCKCDWNFLSLFNYQIVESLLKLCEEVNLSHATFESFWMLHQHFKTNHHSCIDSAKIRGS